MRSISLRVSLVATLAAVASVPASAQSSDEGFFTLQSAAKPGMCLEGNEIGGSQMDGAAFLRACKPDMGQRWLATPNGDGSFSLKNKFKGDLCLDGNVGGGTPRSAAFMGTCGRPSTKWRATPTANGAFQLRNAQYGNTKCLEGNDPNNPAGAAGGASIMWDCANASGQQWTLGRGRLVDGIPQTNAARRSDAAAPGPKPTLQPGTYDFKFANGWAPTVLTLRPNMSYSETGSAIAEKTGTWRQDGENLCKSGDNEECWIKKERLASGDITLTREGITATLTPR